MNQVTLVGRLTRDPELKYIPGSGTPVAKFSIAVDRDYYKKDGTKDTDFIPIEIMGKPAEFCANYLTKGRLVSVVGSMRVDQYKTQEGENRTFTKVSAKSVNVLDSAKKNNQNGNIQENSNQPVFEPSFETPNSFNPSELDPNGFQAIEDDDIPF